MIHDKKASTPASPRNSAGTLPSGETPTPLLNLPTEILTDVFAHAMKGNSAQALRQASDLAVSHPALSAVLAMPGPEQRKYQKLLGQRRIVEELCKAVPAYMRTSSLVQLFDVLPRATQQDLFMESVLWLQKPQKERQITGSTDGIRNASHIKILFTDVQRLTFPQLIEVLLTAAAAEECSRAYNEAHTPWLRQIDKVGRQQIIAAAQSDIGLACLLLKITPDAWSHAELNSIVSPVLAAGHIGERFFVDAFFSTAAKKLTKEHLGLVIVLLAAGGRNESREGAAILKLLSSGIALTQLEQTALCQQLCARYKKMGPFTLDENLPNIGDAAPRLSPFARTLLLPLGFDALESPLTCPGAVEFLLGFWPWIDQKQQQHVADFTHGNMPALCAVDLDGELRTLIPLQIKCTETDALIAKINAARQQLIDETNTNGVSTTKAALKVYVDRNEPVLLNPSFINYEILHALEPGLVQSALLLLIESSDPDGLAVGSRFEAQITYLVTAINFRELESLFIVLKDKPRSQHIHTAFSALCSRAQFLSDKSLQDLTHWILPINSETDGISIYHAMDLLSEQKRMSSSLRSELALWCISSLRERSAWEFPTLARLISQENIV